MKLPEHKCGLYLEHNTYKDIYSPIEAGVAAERDYWISPEEQKQALETGEIWMLQWYPNTPIGFYRLAASTLEALLEAAEIKE